MPPWKDFWLLFKLPCYIILVLYSCRTKIKTLPSAAKKNVVFPKSWTKCYLPSCTVTPQLSHCMISSASSLLSPRQTQQMSMCWVLQVWDLSCKASWEIEKESYFTGAQIWKLNKTNSQSYWYVKNPFTIIFFMVISSAGPSVTGH